MPSVVDGTAVQLQRAAPGYRNDAAGSPGVVGADLARADRVGQRQAALHQHLILLSRILADFQRMAVQVQGRRYVCGNRHGFADAGDISKQRDGLAIVRRLDGFRKGCILSIAYLGNISIISESDNRGERKHHDEHENDDAENTMFIVQFHVNVSLS